MPPGLTTMPVPAPLPPPSRASITVSTSTMAGSVAPATAATLIALLVVDPALGVMAAWAGAPLASTAVPATNVLLSMPAAATVALLYHFER